MGRSSDIWQDNRSIYGRTIAGQENWNYIQQQNKIGYKSMSYIYLTKELKEFFIPRFRVRLVRITLFYSRADGFKIRIR